jgi:hypothetical protein
MYAEGAPPIIYVPMEIFLLNETGNQKRVVYLREGSHTHVFS